MLIGFDLDGVLIRSHESFSEAWYGACQVIGFSGKLLPAPVHLIGMSLESIQRAVFGEPVLGFETAFRKVQDSSRHLDTVYEGAKDLLKALRKAGDSTFILSSRPSFRLSLAMEMLEPSTPDLLVDIHKFGLRPKPSGDGILHASQVFGIDSTSCLFVGDTSIDLQASRDAGCDFVQATWGYGSILDGRNVAHVSSLCELNDFLDLRRLR